MSRPDEVITLLPSEAQTPRERLLARVLDAALRADRAVPGSAAQVLDELPVRAQADLRSLVELARALSASTQAVGPSAAFRHTGRQRLLAAIIAPQASPLLRRLAQGCRSLGRVSGCRPALGGAGLAPQARVGPWPLAGSGPRLPRTTYVLQTLTMTA